MDDAKNQFVTDECDYSWQNIAGIGTVIGHRNPGCTNLDDMTEW